MPPLNFPSAPVDGQVYDNWVYSSAKGAWLAKPLEPTTAVTSDTAPPNPIDGDMWYNTNDGTTYVWYDDGNTSQWVEMTAPITANGYYSPNYIINGAFEINQRGLTSTTANGYGFDGWTTYQQGGGTTTYSAQTFTPGAATTTGYESKNFARLVTSGYSAANTAVQLRQPIEDVRTLAGQPATISFWAKAASGAPKVSIELEQIFGTGGSSANLFNAGFVTISTQWQRYSLTVNVPSVSGKTIGSADDYLGLVFWLAAGTDFASRTNSIGVQNNTFDFWGIQVESGAVATPFRRAGNTLQEELANCQRYYTRFSATSTNSVFPFLGNTVNTTTGFGTLAFPTTMRRDTTTVEYNNLRLNLWGLNATTFTSMTIVAGHCGKDSALFQINGTGFPAAGSIITINSSANTGYVAVSAEY